MLGEYTYTWPVDVKVPKDGRHKTTRFKATFLRIGSDRIQELVAGGSQDTADLRLLRESVVDWEGDLREVLGEPLEYSPEALEELLQVVYVRTAMGMAYIRSLGLPEADRKN